MQCLTNIVAAGWTANLLLDPGTFVELDQFHAPRQVESAAGCAGGLGEGVVITDKTGQPDEDGSNYYVRDGIVIIPKNAEIPAGTRICAAERRIL